METALSIDRWPEGLSEIQGALGTWVEQGLLTSEVAATCTLALEELVTNVFEHGAGASVQITIRCDARHFEAEVVDAGPPFDPLGQPDPDVGAGMEERPAGGLGIFLVKNLVDGIDYRRASGRNHVRLTKRLPDQPTPE